VIADRPGLDGLSETQQRELLARLLRERAARPRIFPVSYAQQRLWLVCQLDPHSGAYNVPSAVRLSGRLDVAALTAAWNGVVRRHEALRTAFGVEEGTPVQKVAPSLQVDLPVIDLGGLPESGSERRRLTLEESARPFDLASWPLARMCLLRLEAGEHVLLVTLHHLISDGWSIGVLVRELASLYRTSATGAPSLLAELRIQYADFANWQREWLEKGEMERQLTFWREALRGAPQVIDLPADRPRPAYPSSRGSILHFHLPVELAAALGEAGRRDGASLFMTLLAGVDVLLFRLTSRSDLLVGSPIANRNRSSTESLIGFFANTVVLRALIDPDAGFRPLLTQVRERTLAAYAHQDLPFDRLVEELRPERESSRTPLFQVMFVLQNAPVPTVDLGGLRMTPLEVERATSRFDLLLGMHETSEGLHGWIEYSTDLFDRATVARTAGHLETLLTAAVASPELPVGDLPLLTAAERTELLGWNDTAVPYPRERSLPALFADQVARTPDAVAALCAGDSWTYRELDGYAARVARGLALQGGAGGEVVGLLAERGLPFLAAVLGIWKAGAAYLPLDPAHPAERHARILEQAGPALLLVQEELAATLAGAPDLPRVLPLAEILGRGDSAAVASGSGPDSLAYVIFTSGSTGLPKGAMVEQRGMVNHLYAKIRDLALDAADTVAQTASQCFDISVWQLIAPLLAGGRVRIYPDEIAHDPVALPERVARDAVTILETVPSLLRAMLEAPRPSAGSHPLAALRWMIPTGEALPPDLCRAWVEICPRVPLLNAYGPTECSDDVTHHPIAAGAAVDGAYVPIGRPVINTRIHLLDSRLYSVPVRVTGEIWVGGDGVGRGYLNDPLRTAQAFLPDPFAAAPGGRLYRTGDLGRRLPDGAIEFLGRIDHQVKVRGFRIELGEIEEALRDAPMVAEAVVAARPGPGGFEPALVAYVVARPGNAADLQRRLRDHLAARLPRYMIPMAFVPLPALPLTSNGKIDHAALPAPDLADRLDGTGYMAPRTTTELRLVEIWEEVLGRRPIGVTDNFFEIGGHSLLATRVIARLVPVLGVEVPLHEFFAGPNIAELAARIDTERGAGRLIAAAPLRPAPRDRAPVLSFAQERLWFLDQFEPDSPAYNLPSAVRIVGVLDPAVLASCFGEVVRRHESLRTTFVAEAGQPRQTIQPFRPVPVPLADLTALPEAVRSDVGRRLASEEAQRPFRLGTGPLLRVALLKLGEREHILLLTMHHIVSDGWSMGVFIREVVALYPELSAGRSPSLPELPIQYRDFAAWQRELLGGEALTEQLAWWRDRLAGAPPVLDLPGRKTALGQPRGVTRRFRLHAPLVRVLKDLGLREGTTLFMTLLAAFDTLLYRHTGQPDLVLGTPVANRSRPEVEGLIGFFVNTLVLRCDLEGDPSFRELLGRVRESALGAYSHQDVPFERLVAELNPERELSRSPIFQAMFTVQNTPPGRLELPGLSFELLETDAESPIFELLLDLIEEGDEIAGILQFRADLFETPLIARLEEHFIALLTGAAAAPQVRLHDLPLLREAERHQLLHEWNDSRADFPDTLCFHHMFAAQAAATPQAVAAECEGRSLTYAELDRAADHLARRLAAQGVNADTPVAVLAHRGLGFLAAIVAVFKAGGAYIPLDPHHPAERHRQILAEGWPVLLMVGEGLEEVAAAAVAALAVAPPLLSLDSAVEETSDGGPLPPRAVPANLAYVIYTSGSTGVPKGAMIDHRGMVNHLFANIAALDLSAADVMAQTASQCFDISVWQFLAPLLLGGRLCIYPDAVAHDPVRLPRQVERDGVTVLEIVPSLMRAVLAEGERRGRERPLAGLRWMIPTGEALPPDLCREWARLYPEVPLLNAYGPAECADDVTLYRLPLETDADAHVAIGRPVANLRVYVLDAALRPVPAGVTGQLWVAGTGVGRGYLNDPRRTAQSFVPDPFAEVPGLRMYGTGDLGRLLPDGTLDFLGRVDHQVKIRGFRIELGEIEARLAEHPEVFEAVALVRCDGAPRLTACVVPRPGQTLDVQELKGFLKQRLPEHMVPASCLILERLPLSPNGKIDRKALAALDDGGPVPSRTWVAPANEVEETLAEMFAAITSVQRVGAFDNFFDLGGHSLLATQVVSRVRDTFEIDLSLRAFFDAPTVAELAVVVERLVIEQLDSLSDEQVDSLLVDA
jgi:amino acid adenylation domain-containing protein